MTYNSLKISEYICKLYPQCARIIFKAKTRMSDIKSNYKRKYQYYFTCPFCRQYDETTDRIFSCYFGFQCNVIIKGTTLISLSTEQKMSKLKKIAKYSVKYVTYRDEMV